MPVATLQIKFGKVFFFGINNNQIKDLIYNYRMGQVS